MKHAVNRGTARALSPDVFRKRCTRRRAPGRRSRRPLIRCPTARVRSLRRSSTDRHQSNASTVCIKSRCARRRGEVPPGVDGGALGARAVAPAGVQRACRTNQRDARSRSRLTDPASRRSVGAERFNQGRNPPAYREPAGPRNERTHIAGGRCGAARRAALRCQRAASGVRKSQTGGRQAGGGCASHSPIPNSHPSANAAPRQRRRHSPGTSSRP